MVHPNKPNSWDQLRLSRSTQVLLQISGKNSGLWCGLIPSIISWQMSGGSVVCLFRELVHTTPLRMPSRAASKPSTYAANEQSAFASGAWPRDARGSTATPDPWDPSQPRQNAYGYGGDSMSGWQQQIAHLQQGSMSEQRATPQHQARFS